VAGHGKVSPWFLFLCRRKTANLIDNNPCDMILTRLKIHVLLFRVLARISIQEGNQGTVISRESILSRIGVQKINRR